MLEQAFKVTSPSARCLLSDPAARVTLAGCCDFKKMLQYRLGKERALVLVSAITFAAPGSASAAGGCGPGAPGSMPKDELRRLATRTPGVMRNKKTLQGKWVPKTKAELIAELPAVKGGRR